MGNDVDSWNDIEVLELMLKEPMTFGIYPETEEERKRYAQLEAEHKKLVERHQKRYIKETSYCGECGKELTEETMWSEVTCKECAERLGLSE